MNPRLADRIEKSLVSLLVLVFVLPLPLAALLRIPAARTPATTWLRNATLGGVQVAPEVVPFSRQTLFSGRYQNALAAGYNFHFAGRELLIRLVNELYLRVFNVAPDGILSGPNRALVMPDYAREYCFLRGDDALLLPLVEGLRRMQDICDARGQPFAFVITPSKPSVYPEDLPPAWRRRYQPEPRYYDRMLTLLQRERVRYVDGHRLTAELKSRVTVPLFPLGGIHWDEHAALLTANATVELLASRGLSAQPVQDYRLETAGDAEGEDRDIVALMNIAAPLRYPATRVVVQSTPAPALRRPNMVLVGGSFCFKFGLALDSMRQFSEIDHYFYYIRAKYCLADGERFTIASPTAPMDFPSDVWAADALVLEANEENLSTGSQHLVAFMRDALASPPGPGVAKVPFHAESVMNYRWGDTLSLAGDSPSVNTAALGHFSPRTAAGAFTIGPVAMVRLHTAATDRDMALEINANAFLVDTRLPEQQVEVFANGRSVGRWTWRAETPPAHRLVIPKDLLGGGELRLEFHVARPASPAEFGLSADTNPYGMLLVNLRLRAADE